MNKMMKLKTPVAIPFEDGKIETIHIGVPQLMLHEKPPVIRVQVVLGGMGPGHGKSVDIPLARVDSLMLQDTVLEAVAAKYGELIDPEAEAAAAVPAAEPAPEPKPIFKKK